MAINHICRMLSSGTNVNNSTTTEAIVEKHHEGTLDLSITTLVVKFVSIIREYTEQMETSSEILLACAKALQKNGTILLGGNQQIQNTGNASGFLLQSVVCLFFFLS